MQLRPISHRFVSLVVLAVALALPSRAQDPVYYFNPDWSPDGKTVVFESTRDGNFAIYTIRVDSTGLTKLTEDDFDEENPRWSPDGKKIAYISNRHDRLQIYVMNADGSEAKRLMESDSVDYSPFWSRDGKWIAFNSRPNRGGVLHDVCVVRADGGGRRCLTDQSANELQPRWSPDGKRLVFLRNHPPKPDYRAMSEQEREKMRRSAEIWVIGADGTGEVNLTRNDVNDCCAYFSKDGRAIYFRSERDGTAAIWAMDPDGSHARRIADGTVVTDPNVSPDGRYFVYTRQQGGEWGVFIWDIGAGAERRLVGGGD